VSDLESAYIPFLNGQIAQPTPDDGKPHIWAQKGFTFHDLLDAINPLQHLPVISTVYRWITGDTIGNLPRIVGDALYGGIPGFVSGLVGVLLKEETGKDVGEHVVATLFGDSKTGAPAAETAQQPELTTEQAAALTHAPIEVASLAPPTADAEASAPPTPTSSPATPSAPAPSSAPPVPAVAAAPVQPDHAPIPLVRGLGMSVAAPAAAPVATASKNPAVDAFLALAAERQRQALGAAVPAGPGRVLSAQPVPLQLPPGSVALASRPRTTLASVPTSPLAAVAPASGGPVDISQKMLDALDKYVALQKQNSAIRDARGTQVDVSP
jgi:hypothetical protein